jgi:hypothetical protein
MMQMIIIDSEIPPGKFMFEGIDITGLGPEFSISELVKVFFAKKTDHWIRWKEREGAFKINGQPVGQRRTDKGSRTWNLAEIEQMLHAAALDDSITGAQLMAGLRIVKALGVTYGLLTEPPPLPGA